MLGRLIIISFAYMFCTIAHADLYFDKSKANIQSAMSPVNHVNFASQYNCRGNFLIFTASATISESGSSSSVVSASVMASDNRFDVSTSLNKIIEPGDLLQKALYVSCDSASGSFNMEFLPGRFTGETDRSVTAIEIYPDGTVEGYRTKS